MSIIKNKGDTASKLARLGACAAVAVALAMPAMPAFAGNNHEDTDFWASTDNSPTPWYTAHRDKEDYTSSYVTACSGSTLAYFEMSVYAATGGNWMGNYEGYPVNVGSPPYRTIQSNAQYMINYVKENGYNDACIRIDSSLGYGSVGFWWSPDSI